MPETDLNTRQDEPCQTEKLTECEVEANPEKTLKRNSTHTYTYFYPDTIFWSPGLKLAICLFYLRGKCLQFSKQIDELEAWNVNKAAQPGGLMKVWM